MCMIDDCDPATLYREKFQRSRKDRKCDECHRPIETGEGYHYASMLSDGYFAAYHTCQHCRMAAGWLTHICSGFVYDFILEDLQNHWVEEAYPVRSLFLGRLIVGMRRQWRNIAIDDVRRWAAGGVALVRLPLPQ